MAKRLASHVMQEAQPRSPAQGAKPMRTSSGNGGQNASEAIQSTKHGSQDASKAAQPSYDNSSEDAPLAIQPSSDGGSQGDSLAIQPTSDNSTQDALESIQGGTIFNSAEPGKTGKTSSGNIYINASNSNVHITQISPGTDNNMPVGSNNVDNDSRTEAHGATDTPSSAGSSLLSSTSEPANASSSTQATTAVQAASPLPIAGSSPTIDSTSNPSTSPPPSSSASAKQSTGQPSACTSEPFMDNVLIALIGQLFVSATKMVITFGCNHPVVCTVIVIAGTTYIVMKKQQRGAVPKNDEGAEGVESTSPSQSPGPSTWNTGLWANQDRDATETENSDFASEPAHDQPELRR